jgi:2-iminobutanoate/2-iminopropanoate deaminase
VHEARHPYAAGLDCLPRKLPLPGTFAQEPLPGQEELNLIRKSVSKKSANKKFKKDVKKAATAAPAKAPSATTNTRFVNRPGRPAAWPFSDGAWVGPTFYVSGHLGLDPVTRVPPEEPEQEARLMLDGVKATLAAAGLAMADLVWVQIYCSDVSLFTRFNDVYRTYFGGEFPARAFLGSGPLLFGCRFEVLGIAAKR